MFVISDDVMSFVWCEHYREVLFLEYILIIGKGLSLSLQCCHIQATLDVIIVRLLPVSAIIQSISK